MYDVHDLATIGLVSLSIVAFSGILEIIDESLNYPTEHKVRIRVHLTNPVGEMSK